MSVLLSDRPPCPQGRVSRSLVSLSLAVLALGAGLAGCASVGDNMSAAFSDPAKYDLYECKQLEPERLSLATRIKDQQALMAKAETGVAGSLVAEVAYRNELIALQSQQKLAEEAWRRNRCHETPPEAKPAAVAPIVAPAPGPGIKGSRSSRQG